MTTRRLLLLGRHPMVVVGLVLGVLMMHGLGDPAMSHSGMAMGETSMAAGSVSGGTPQAPMEANHRHPMPSVPAGEMAIAAICAFAVLLAPDRVTRTGSGSFGAFIPIEILRSIVAGGPEPPVPRLV